ncbi:MAG: hypothetical protein WKG07_30735 [Hymenobacter sp.]
MMPAPAALPGAHSTARTLQLINRRQVPVAALRYNVALHLLEAQ